MAELSKRQGGAAQGRRDQQRDSSEAGSSERNREPTQGGGKADGEQSLGSLVVKQTKALVGEQVSQRAGKPAADLGKLAKALELTSEQLEGNLASPYIRKAASQLERFAQFLENASGEESLRKVEAFARNQPLLFLGGAAVLGLSGARFLKATGHRRMTESNQT